MTAEESVAIDAEDGTKLTKRELAALAAAHESEETMLTQAGNFHNAVPGIGPVASMDGYIVRTLANGVKQYYSLHDGWNSPDEALVRARVADYRARLTGRVSG